MRWWLLSRRIVERVIVVGSAAWLIEFCCGRQQFNFDECKRASCVLQGQQSGLKFHDGPAVIKRNEGADIGLHRFMKGSCSFKQCCEFFFAHSVGW